MNMLSFSFVFMSIVLHLVAILKKQIENRFIKTCKFGTAVVSSYEIIEASTRLKMFVRVDGVTYKSKFINGMEIKTSNFCSTGKVKQSDFPIGTRVKVKYLEGKFGVCMIRLDEVGFEQTNGIIVSIVINVIAALFLIAAIIIAIV